MKISNKIARYALLHAQGLRKRSEAATKWDVLQAIRQMGALQIDTINVVARSPYLVLWSRLGDYNPRWLDELHAEGYLFEYWSHAACFLPIEDYPIYRRRMIERSKTLARWYQVDSDIVNSVLDFVCNYGPVLSSSFPNLDKRAGGWWNRKPEKEALEYLFDIGMLMVKERRNFQRVYDLRERVLPDWDDSNVPSTEEMNKSLVLKSAKAMGVAKLTWISDYFRLDKTSTVTAVKQLLDEGELIQVEVEGWDVPAIVNSSFISELDAIEEMISNSHITTFLSPFDPVIWDRKRALELFGFDYKIEVYTPASKRIYGYFTLPILYKGRIIGRIDPKSHRKDGVMEIRSLHLEPEIEIDDELILEVGEALRSFAKWHGTPELLIKQAPFQIY